jgi:DNA repair exonuclease SbcCD nuclease subunit
MVKKLFHIADLHFRTYKRLDESELVCQKFLEEVSKYIEDNNLIHNEVRIVIAGDIVHQKITISNELSVLVTWFLDECTKLCPVIVIAGNHDLLENNKERVDSLTPVIEKRTFSENVSYFKESKCYLDDNIVWCVYSIFEENVRPNIKEAKKLYGKDKKYIGLFHAPVNGAITSIGFEFEDHSELEQFDGCDAVLMGDIHHRQNFVRKGTNITYCGSLIQQDFGERVSGHGYLVWDVEHLDYTEHDIKTDYGYYVFKINSLDDIDNEREYLTNS